jgi:hypothetical protein
MMSKLQRITLSVALLFLPSLAMAQLDTDHPGYFPIEDLGILPEDKINLEINLPGAMLKFIAAVTDEEDPDLSRIAENLKSIRVRGAELDETGLEGVRSGFQNAAEKLKAAGWSSMVRVREEDEEVYIFFKEEMGQMLGLTVLTLEDAEAMMINLVGNIDPSDLAGLAEGLDLDLPDMKSVTDN